MADLSYSILIDAHQAQNAAQRLEASLKRVDSATYSLTKSLGKAKDVMKRDLASAMTMVAEANTLLKTSFSEFGPKVTAAGNDISAMSKRIAAASKDAKTAYSNFKDSISESDAAFKKAEKAGDVYLAQLQKLSSASRVTSKDLQKLESLRKGWESSRGTAMSSSPTLNAAYSQYQKSATTSHASLQKELRNTNELIKLLEADHAKAASRYKKTEKAVGDLSVVLFTLRQQYDSIKAADRDLSLGQKIAKAEKEYNNLSKTLDTAAKSVANLAGKLQMARQTREDLNQRIAVSNNYMRLGSEAVSVHAARLKGLNDVTTQTANSLDQLNARLASNKQSTLRTSAESKADRLQALQNSSFLNPFRDITADSVDTVSAFGMITKSARNALYAVNAVRIAINLAFAASGIGAGVRVIADYDQTLADLSSTIRPAGAETAEFRHQMEALKTTMEELGATSRFTTAEAGQGMIYMAQAGLSAGEVVSASKDVIDLAVASNTSLERSSDIVVQTMRTFGIAASEAWKVTDTLAVGAKESVTSIEQLATALHYVGPIAHTLGVQIDTTVAALGTLSDSGLQASMAGTGLRRVISEIVNPTAKARKILDAAGLTIDKLNIQGLGLVEVLRNIKAANLSVGESFAVWGDRGTPALQTLMTNFDKFEDKLEAIDLANIKGTASEMRKEREATLSGQFKALNSAIQEFIIKSSQYTGFTRTLTDILGYFATTLRDWNAEIHNTLSSIAAWGSALGGLIITQKLLHGGTTTLSKGLSSYTRDIQVAARAYRLFKAEQDLAASGMNIFQRAVVNTRAVMSKWVATSRIMAGIAKTISMVFSTLASIGISAIAGVAVGAVAKYATSADELEVTMKSLTAYTDAFWEKQLRGAQEATAFLDSYALGLTNLSKTAFEVTTARTKDQYRVLGDALLKPENTYLSGSRFATDASSIDMGSIIFGRTTSELLDMQMPQLQELLYIQEKLDAEAEKSGQNRWSIYSEEEQERLKQYLGLFKQLLSANQQFNLQQKEAARRNAESSTLDFATEYIKTSASATKLLQETFQTFSGVLSQMKTSEIETAIDKLYKKRNELLAPAGSEESQSFWKTLIGTQDVENVARFFDIDATNFTVKLKASVQRLYGAAQTQVSVAQEKFYDDLVASGKKPEDALREAQEKAIGLRANILKQLNIDESALQNFQKQASRLGEASRALQEMRIEKELSTFLKSSESANSLVAVGDQAQTAKNKLLELYSIDQLAPFEIQFTDTMATVVAAEGAVTAETQAMQGQIEKSLDAIYKALGNFSASKFKTFVANQSVLSGLDKRTRKQVEGFARASGISPSLYNPVTQQFAGTSEIPAQQVNDAFTAYKKDDASRDAKKLTKWEKDIESQIAELGLKYKQYYAEIFTGSDSQVKIKKLEIEQLKEESDLISKAAALGISSSDQRIQSLIAENKRVTDLRIAYEKFQAPLALGEAKGEADLAEAQIHGAEAYSVQIENLNRKLRNLKDLQKNWSIEGSEQWHNYRQQIADTQRSLEDLKKKLEEIRMSSRIELLMKTGSVASTREAQVADVDRQLKDLQNTLYPGMTTEEYEIYNNKRKLLENERHRAADTEPWRAVPETLNQMASQYSEWAMMSNMVSQGFDMMTESVINFITTGKFSFSEFTQQVGTMLVELTTKMMMFKMLSSFIPGMGFADGGMANVKAFAVGGFTNVKKFASGGMLTGPTLFNSSSGLALAGEAGYEHLMPAARLSNGKWGVYAEGMGGNNNQFVINTNINVEGGSSGNAEDDNKLAATISEKVSQSIKDTVKAELVQQMRAGGLLNSNGNKRW